MTVRTAGLVLVLVLVLAGPATAAVTSTGPTGSTPPGMSTTGTTAASTGTTGTTSSNTGSTAASNETSDSSNDDDNRLMAALIFILGIAVVALAYVFYDRWRKSYEKLAEAALQKTGQFPQTVFDPVAKEQFRARSISAESAKEQPVVTGPAAVVVGEPTVYKATAADAPATSCAWSVQPSATVTVEPSTGAETTLTASEPGPITLTAKLGDGNPTLVHVTAIAKDGNGGGVPLLGTGFAGTAAAITAFAIAGGLTALHILSGAAFIAFLGPIVGYFFAQARDSTQGGTPPAQSGGGGGAQR